MPEPTEAAEPTNSSTVLHDIGKQRARLLVVDDQPVNIQIVHQIFADEHEVFMATSGAQALALCRSDPPDLILLDAVMPGMDGVEVCRRLKEHADTRDIPVIFVTGHNDQDAESACWNAGGVDFITKPLNPRTVRARVHVHLTLKLQTDLLRQMVFIDGLTGVANRRYFDERLSSEWRSAQRHSYPLALAMIDIDHFKRFNDTYGHPAGDEGLRKIAACIKRELNRPRDLAARYGGEEFACILPETDLAGAILTAKTIEQAVRDLRIVHQGSNPHSVLSISIGVASLLPKQDEHPNKLIAQADECLYEAKKAGRGRIWPEA